MAPQFTSNWSQDDDQTATGRSRFTTTSFSSIIPLIGTKNLSRPLAKTSPSWYDLVDCNLERDWGCGCSCCHINLLAGQKILFGEMTVKKPIKVVANSTIKESSKFSTHRPSRRLTVLQHATVNIVNP
jgi:hypothetical protein